MDITCIGHITRDKIVTPQLTTYMAGGTTTYVAMGLHALLQEATPEQREAIPFHLIASLSADDQTIVDEMRQLGIKVDVIPSLQTTFFENIYGVDSSDRKQNVRSTGDPFSVEKLKPWIEPLAGNRNEHYILLGSLLADDFPLEVVRYCRQYGRVVMDAQGYFRKVVFSDVANQEISVPDNKNRQPLHAIPCERIGKVHECDWTQKDAFLENIDVLKLNENEARLITHETDLHEAARLLHEQGVAEVLLTLGRDGSIIAANGQVYDIKVVPENCTVDATGCGDTYVMAYIYRRSKGDSPYDAACFASSAATFKLESTGPLKASEAKVCARMNK